jgi:hypothetical protein
MRQVRNGSNNRPAKGKSTVIGKSPAQRRLGRILEADALAIIVTNRRARIGLKPKSISRFEN